MTNISQFRIGDLIEVPQVKTVIELAEARDLDPDDPASRAALEMLANSFIVSDDIHEILTIVFGAIAKNEGRGFFIAGNYGSGKSHLLSVISLAARYQWPWTSLVDQDNRLLDLQIALKNNKCLPVLIPLTDFSNEMPLEEIIWECIEITAATAGIPLSLSHTQRFLHLFKKYLLPVHETEFLEFIQQRLGNEYSWERIQREDPASAHTLILQFTQETGNSIPFRVAPDRRAATKEIVSTLLSCGWTGMVIVLDELSEFLKSKVDTKALNEDARFLQFLGEISTHNPIWIIGALQEAIERTGEIRESVFKKIKDRYSHRLRLSTRHLKELVAKRLIRQKDQKAESIIRDVHRKLHKAFNQIQISEDDFLKIYPVHPETFELLDKNSDLFSQRRGIVDFLTARISGREEDQIKGILDNPADQLLTPDTIFDHFQDRLAESPDLSNYFRLLKDHFEPRIELLFESDADKAAAVKLIKILILLAISPLKDDRTVQELTNMILHHAVDPELPAGRINYEYVNQEILSVLYRKAGHLNLNSADDPLNNVYRIDVKFDLSESIEARIRRVIGDLSPLASNVISTAYTTMSHGLFPMAMLQNRTSIRDGIRWENTFRKIAVRLCNFCELKSENTKPLFDQLRNGSIDYILFLGWIGDTDAQKIAAQKILSLESSDIANGTGFWLPHTPEDPAFFTPLLDLFGCRQLVSEYTKNPSSEATQILELLQDQLEQHTRDTYGKIAECYLNGTLITLGMRKCQLTKHHFEHFDQWLMNVIKTGLNLRFPDHHQVSPNLEISGKVLLDLLLDRLIRPGQIKELHSQKDDALISALTHIAIPLGLAVKDGNSYRLSAIPKSCPAARYIMNAIPASEGLELPLQDRQLILDSLFRQLAASKIGISQPVFDLTITSLIRKGYLSAFIKDRTVPIDQIRFPLSSVIESLTRGNLIPSRYRPAFAQVYKLLTRKQLKEFDLDVQEDLWIKLQTTCSKWSCDVELFSEVTRDILSRYSDTPGNLNRSQNILQSIRSIYQLTSQDLDAHEGWLRFLPAIIRIGDFSSILEQFKSISAFVHTGKEPYLQARAYLNDVRLQPDNWSEKYQTLKYFHDIAVDQEQFRDDLIFENGLQKFLNAFDNFKDKYHEQYLKEHSCRSESIRSLNPGSIKNSFELSVLRRLSRLSPISARFHYKKIEQVMKEMLDQYCSREPAVIIQQTPVCSCQFKLGDATKIVTEDEIKSYIVQGIREYASLLKHEPTYSNLMILLEKLPEQHKNNLEILLSLDPSDATLVVKLDQLLTENLVDAIHKNISTQFRMVRHKISRLVQELSGQRLTVTQIRKIFDEWLLSQGKLDENHLIFIDE